MSAIRIIVAFIALTAITSTAQAEWVGRSTSREIGNSHVKGKFYAKAGVTYCSAGDLADASAALEQAWQNPADIHGVILASLDPCLQSAEDQFAEVEAYGKGTINLFGKSESAYVKAGGRDVDGFKTAYVRIVAFGTTLYSRQDDGIVISRGAEFKKEKKFGVGGLNVKVKGSAGAMLGVSLNGDFNAERVIVFATPFLTAGVSASASIGVACANASIQGDIDVLDLELPATMEVGFVGGIDYDLDVDLDYAMMDGELKVKLSYCLGDASKTLADYSGYNGHRDVFNASGRF